MRSVISLAIIVIVLIVGLALYFGYPYFLAEPSFPIETLTSKSALSGEFIENPDLIYPTFGWLLATPVNLATNASIINETGKWKGDAFITRGAYLGTLDNARYGIAIIAPFNKSVPRYLEQSTFLPKNNMYILNLGLVVNDALGNASGCTDAGVKLIIHDNTKNKIYTVFEKTIKNDQWYDYSVDLGSKFSGDDITVRIESFVPSTDCLLWDKEWASVDYLDIVTK